MLLKYKQMSFKWWVKCKEYENKENIPENIPTHVAEERENRYVANHEMIGSTPVTAKATADAIAQPM